MQLEWAYNGTAMGTAMIICVYLWSHVTGMPEFSFQCKRSYPGLTGRSFQTPLVQLLQASHVPLLTHR